MKLDMNQQAKTAGEPLIRILHPSDCSKASRVAFAHALKIALTSNAELEIVHVERHKVGREKDIHWSEFSGVRATLARWNILLAEASAEEVSKTGLREINPHFRKRPVGGDS